MFSPDPVCRGGCLCRNLWILNKVKGKKSSIPVWQYPPSRIRKGAKRGRKREKDSDWQTKRQRESRLQQLKQTGQVRQILFSIRFWTFKQSKSTLL